MADPSNVARIRSELRHGFQYTLPRTALNDVETLLQAYDAEKYRRERYQRTLQGVYAWARETDNHELLVLLHDVGDMHDE